MLGKEAESSFGSYPFSSALSPVALLFLNYLDADFR